MKLKLQTFLWLTLLNIISITAQTTYYVSVSGSNNNDGLLTSTPYKTIGYAIDQFDSTQNGTIVVMEGIYHEELILDNKNNITIKADTNANVVIDGTEIIDSTWEKHTGNIYKTQLPTDIWQLFIDGEQQVMARWPNTSFENDEIYDKHYRASSFEGDYKNTGKLTPDGVVIDNTQTNPELHNNQPDISTIGSINGGLIIANFGSFRTFVRSITSDVDANKSFTYDKIEPNVVFNNDPNDYKYYVKKHHFYFLEGKLELLDSEKEWFFDKNTKTLYAWSNNSGVDLQSSEVKGKTQSYAFDIRNSENTKIEGFKFFGTTVRIENGNNITVENNVFSFPNYSKRMLGIKTSPLVTNIDQDLNTGKLKSTSLSRSCKFIGNVFEYTDGEALIFSGDNHEIDNNYFHHIDWSCGETQGLGLTINGDARSYNYKFTRNIIHTVGASATLGLGRAAYIAYNDVSNTGLGQSDGSIIQLVPAQAPGSEAAYNWLHDTTKYGFRTDGANRPACNGGEGALVHHNVMWNLGITPGDSGGIGLMMKGNSHDLYNNTIFNNMNADILILSETCDSSTRIETGVSNDKTYLKNNLADRISDHRTVPTNTESDIKCFKSNNYSTFVNGEDNVVAPLLTNIVTYNPNTVLEDISKYDFRINTSVSESTNIINQGTPITSLQNSTATDPNNPSATDYDITANYKDTNPDIGAYENGGENWKPGITFTPVRYPWVWPTVNSTPIITAPVPQSNGFINRNTFEQDDSGSLWTTNGTAAITNDVYYGATGNSYTVMGQNDVSTGKLRVFSDKNFTYTPDFTTTSTVRVEISFMMKLDSDQDPTDQIKVLFKDDSNGISISNTINIGDSNNPYHINSSTGWKKLTASWNGEPYNLTYKGYVQLNLGNLTGNIYLDDFTSTITDENLLSVKKYTNNKINIYPQPVKQGGEIKLSTSKNIIRYTLYSSLGELITKENYTKISIPKSCAKGVYFLIIELDDGQTISKKIIII